MQEGDVTSLCPGVIPGPPDEGHPFIRHEYRAAMGAWSVEPFGNDVAADWAWELEDESDWTVVDEALAEALEDGEEIDHDTAVIAVAAAEVVAHGLGHATQRDAYTEEVDSFIARVGRPTEDTVALAIAALVAACGPGSELAADWAGTGDPGWDESIEHLRAALSG